MTNWPAPKRTDMQELQRREEAYQIRYQMQQEWNVEPGKSVYEGAFDSTFCDIRNKDGVLIATGIRQIWASHIVMLHNSWFGDHRDDPPPAI